MRSRRLWRRLVPESPHSDACRNSNYNSSSSSGAERRGGTADMGSRRLGRGRVAMKVMVFSSAVVALAACASALGQVQIPHKFSSGGPARAADVNENFEALAAGINASNAAIRNSPAGPAGPPGPAGAAGVAVPAGPPGPAVPAGTVGTGGTADAAASVAIVAAVGGNYATPQYAVANLTASDAWCRLGQRRSRLRSPAWSALRPEFTSFRRLWSFRHS